MPHNIINFASSDKLLTYNEFVYQLHKYGCSSPSLSIQSIDNLKKHIQISNNVNRNTKN